jgi:hypothetical protein
MICLKMTRRMEERWSASDATSLIMCPRVNGEIGSQWQFPVTFTCFSEKVLCCLTDRAAVRGVEGSDYVITIRKIRMEIRQ